MRPSSTITYLIQYDVETLQLVFHMYAQDFSAFDYHGVKQEAMDYIALSK